ncbi:MAG: FAD-binding protein [Proteobacteria bacterium]|nr:FAD-binding protein [Pseudomonadota bacterium]
MSAPAAASPDSQRLSDCLADPGEARRREVVAALAAAVPGCALVTELAERRAYECDGLAAFRALPLAVALPASEAEAAAVLRVCHGLGVPVVARGAGTGLSGGAMPHAAGVVLSLARMNRILELDPRAGLARVEPGVRNLAISEAAAPHGLYYAPDPSSQVACTIGGNVAENAGGVHCLKYGLTLHNVLRVRALSVAGEPLEFGSLALDAPGLDLLALAIGSEGLLAVVTEVTVKLLPRPAVARVVMASFDDVGRAGEAVAAIIAAGIIPAGLEMMDRRATAAVEPFVQAGYDLDAAAILLAESDGTAAEVEAEITQLEQLLRGAGATACAVSRSEAERLRFWSGRKNAFPAAGRVSPDYYCMDGTIPRRHLGRVLEAIAGFEREFGLRCMNVFHAGDGNLHPLILYDANVPGEWERAERFGAAIVELCVELGGTITGEHGVGVEKINSMCVQFSDAERAAFCAVKHAFDPAGLLNPGKLIPTLHRCAEYGRLHVHGGRLPHADLPRF